VDQDSLTGYGVFCVKHQNAEAMTIVCYWFEWWECKKKKKRN